MKKHYTQQSEGHVAERHARVLLAQNPTQLEAAYDDWAVNYDNDLQTICGNKENTSALVACRILIKYFKNPQEYQNLQILDFGCGTGSAAVFLHKHGWNTKLQLDGCDLSSGMLEQARKHDLYKQLIKSDYKKSNCLYGTYDILHSSAVFAPGQAPPSTFDEFYKLLKNDSGYAIFTIRCEYYDSDEGKDHRQKLEHMINIENKWELISKTKQDYLPKDNVMAYVFVLKKRKKSENGEKEKEDMN